MTQMVVDGSGASGRPAGPTGHRPWTVRVVEDRLRAAGVPSPAADARWLVEHVLEVGDGSADPSLLEELVAARCRRVPVQLLLGRWPFREVELSCRAGVFVPRPETEVVAGIAIGYARAAGPAPLVIEPCTGGGAIACSLVAEVPGVRVVAGDRDPRAVALARDNLRGVCRGHDPCDGHVVVSDLLDGFDPALRGTVDVLVANPPYLPARDRGSWSPEVAEHDPESALVGGVDGHEVVDELLRLAAMWLRPGGTIVLEIDERRGGDALAAAAAARLVDAAVIPDLSGAPRAVVARRPAAGGPPVGDVCAGGRKRA